MRRNEIYTLHYLKFLPYSVIVVPPIFEFSVTLAAIAYLATPPPQPT